MERLKRTKTKSAKSNNLSKQIEGKVKRNKKNKKNKETELDGDISKIISTGSTLLDLAISGGRVHGGGIPAGILVEIFGESSSGKTVLLMELAAAVKRKDGEVLFKDPEGRLDKKFASIFDLDLAEIDYSQPDTVEDVFKPIRDWVPSNTDIVNGIFTDSLAALTTELEMNDDDAYGMKRAKDFSTELRKTCRHLVKHNLLLVASNQVRENVGVTFGHKTKSPGGKAIPFYSSLRLRAVKTDKITDKKKIHGKEVKRVKAVRTQFEVFKSSVWEPYRTAPVTIDFKYGIDDIRENLQFLKDYSSNNMYYIGDTKLDKSLLKAINIVEEENLEQELREEVIKLWHEIEKKFAIKRKKKVRA